MPNVRISDLPDITLPIDAGQTFFETQTVEGGIPVSRRARADQLLFNVFPPPTADFTTVRGDFASGLFVENLLLLVDDISGQVTVGGLTQSERIIAGDPGTEGTGIVVNGTLFESVLKASDLGGTNVAETILHRHSTGLPPILVGSRSHSNDDTHSIVLDGDGLLSIFGVGWDGVDYAISSEIRMEVDGTPGIDDMPGQISFLTSPAGSDNPVERMVIGPDGIVSISGTAAFQVPAGTTAQEPPSINGMLRYNTDENEFQGVVQGAWEPLSNRGLQGFGVWVYEQDTGTPPLSGEIRFNNADPSLATSVFVSETNSAATDVGSLLALLTAGSLIYIQDQKDNTNFIVIEVGTYTDQGTYAEYTIAQSSQEGAGFVDTQNIFLVGTAGGGGGGGLPSGVLGDIAYISTAPSTYTATSAVSVNPTGAVTIQFNTADKIKSAQDGVELIGQSDILNLISFRNLADTLDQGFVGFPNATSFSVRNNILNGQTHIQGRDGGGTVNFFQGTPGGSARMYQANVLVAETLTAAAGGLQANNTLTGGGFERVLTTSDSVALPAGALGDIAYISTAPGTYTATGAVSVDPAGAVTMDFNTALALQTEGPNLFGSGYAGGGFTVLTNAMAGVSFNAVTMDTTNQYTAGVKFTSTDANFTTENPKFLAAVIGRAAEAYAADTDGGMDLDFFTTPLNPGATSLPELAMRLTNDKQLRVYGTEFQTLNGEAVFDWTNNAGLRLRFNNLIALETVAGGVDVFDTSGDTPALRFKEDNGTVTGQIIARSSTTQGMTIRADQDSNPIFIQGFEIAGGTLVTGIDFDPDAGVQLWANTGATTEVMIQTVDPDATGQASGAEIRDGKNIFRPVGYNVMPSESANANQNFLKNEIGRAMYRTDAVNKTFTVISDGTIPDGSVWTVINDGTGGTVTIAQGGGTTLKWMDGGGVAPPTGNRTLARAGVATVWKQAGVNYQIWGTGLT